MGGGGFALHPATLLFATTLLAFLCGGVLLLAQGGRQPDDESLRTWGLAMVLGGLGAGLSVMGVGFPSIAIGLSNLFILGARAMAWNGARRFVGKPVSVFWANLGLVIWAVTIPFQTTLAWLPLAGALGAAYTVAAAAELWPRPGSEALPARLPLLVLLMSHAVFYAMRVLFSVSGLGQGTPNESILVVVVIEALLNTVGMALLLLSLVKERVELRSIAQLQALALLDGLTGIGNRRHFDDCLKAELRRSRRSGTDLALLMIDVDHFKAFNDAYGHQRGDACLRLIAQTIEGCMRRPGDMVARYGGEEFAVLLPGTDAAGATELAGLILAAVRELNEPAPGEAGVVTVSIGVAAAAAAAAPLEGEALIRAADVALYAAKGGGRDRLHPRISEAVRV